MGTRGSEVVVCVQFILSLVAEEIQEVATSAIPVKSS